MNKLAALTQQLVDIGDIPFSQSSPGVKEYDLERGTALVFTLLKKVGVLVMDSFMSKGSVFPYHKHEKSIEIIIVYEGRLKIVSEDGDVKCISAGEHISLDMNQGHFVTAKEDTWSIAITIPADDKL